MSYKLKTINEDFQVTEVPLLPVVGPKDSSKYTYLWVRKSGFTTFQAIDRLKRHFGLEFSDLANQGLKDEDAITEQIISIRKILVEKDIRGFNLKHRTKNNFVEIARIMGYGKEPVKERALHGNSFHIVVRNLTAPVVKKLAKNLETNREQIMVNYYDSQRFGMPGGPYNTHLIGRAIARGNWHEARKHARKTGNFDPKDANWKATDPQLLFRSINPKTVAFFVSAYSSFLWNEAASQQIKRGGVANKYTIPNVGKLNLPLPGSSHAAGICVARSYEFKVDEFSVVSKDKKRNLTVSTAVYLHSTGDDDLHPGRKKAAISFFLPTGSYATMLIQQMFLKFK